MKQVLRRIRRIDKYLVRLLILNELRHYFCFARWQLMKHRLRFLDAKNNETPQKGIDHNYSAMKNSVAFGMHNRMTKVLYPLSSLIADHGKAKILILGPRTEDDIFLCKSLGMHNCRGLDLFTYSPLIQLGDMHEMPFPSGEFDAVVMGWVLYYSRNPIKAINEVTRVMKPGGLLAIGWAEEKTEDRANSFNSIYTAEDHTILISQGFDVCHINNDERFLSGDRCIIARKMHKSPPQQA